MEADVNSRIQSNMASEPISISSDVAVEDAQEVMRSWGMRHLPIVDGTTLVGLISERDILKAYALHKSGKTKVKDIMTRSPYQVREEVSVAEVSKTMADNKYGCAVVTNSRDQVVGIFTTTDALHMLSRILQEPIEVDYRAFQLRQYLARLRRPA